MSFDAAPLVKLFTAFDRDDEPDRRDARLEGHPGRHEVLAMRRTRSRIAAAQKTERAESIGALTSSAKAPVAVDPGEKPGAATTTGSGRPGFYEHDEVLREDGDETIRLRVAPERAERGPPPPSV